MKMPVELAAEVYQREGCARSFREDLELHLLNGFVFSTPEFFAMGRPVVKGADKALIVNPAELFPDAACDCWHVYLFSGAMTQAFNVIPWELPWFSFERGNELRFYPVSSIRRLSGAFPHPL